MLESTVGLLDLGSKIKNLSDGQRETLVQRFKWKLSWLNLGLTLSSLEHLVKILLVVMHFTLFFSFEASTCSCFQSQNKA